MSLCRSGRGELVGSVGLQPAQVSVRVSRKPLKMMGPSLLADSVPTAHVLLGKPRCC